jgi:protein CpxP
MKSSNTRILTIAVVLLLLTNIALVAFIVMGKNSRGGKPGGGGRFSTSEMMAKELNMTEQQKKDHKQLKEDHLKNIKPLFDSIRSAKTSLYALLKDSTVNDSLVTVYTRVIGEKQSMIDQLTFAHFRRIRNLFTPEQQPKFDGFIQKMMQRGGGRKDSTAKKD